MKNHKSNIVLFATALMSSVLLFTSCIWVTAFETAQTAPAGKVQFGGSLSPILYSKFEGGSETAILPFPEMSVKLGLTDNMDIGARWGFGPGLALNTKYQFLKNGIDGAIFLEGLYYGLGSVGGDNSFSIYNVRPAVIFSQEHPGRFPFSIALGLHYWSTGVGGSRVGITSLFSNLGLPFRFGNNRSLRIMPELGILLPLSGSTSDGNDDVFDFTGQTLIQFGIGFSGAKGVEE